MPAINSKQIKNFVPVVTINNIEVPAYKWNCTRPTYGSVGSFRMHMSREVLVNSGISIYQIGKSAVGQIPVHISMRDTDTGDVYLLFGGELDTIIVEYDVDTVIVEGRDWAGFLVDQKGSPAYRTVINPGSDQSLVPDPCNNAGKMAPTGTGSSFDASVVALDNGINIINQTPSSLAYLIAVQNGYNPDIYQTSNELTVGDITKGVAASLTDPRSWWTWLQFLARLMGWACYVTPAKTLYFGPYDMTTTVSLSWGVAGLAKGVLPARNMHITYNPRRNSSFLVLVVSAHGGMATQTVGAAATVDPKTLLMLQQTNPNINVDKAGYAIGSAGATSAYQLSAYFSNLGKPVYLYSYQNLTPNQAAAKALEIMYDIAKRELILRATVDGNPFIEPMISVNLTGDTGDFSVKQYYINGIEHSYDVDDEGWYTHISAWTLPPVTTDQFLAANNINGVSMETSAPTKYTPK